MPVAATSAEGDRERLDTSAARRLPARVFAVVLVLFCAVTASFEMAAAQISATTGDAATALLEGRALDSGHLLLHGWSLSLDSFWALEATAYALVLPFTGVHLYVLHVEPALLAAATLFLGIGLVASGQSHRGRVAAVGALLALVAFPPPVLAYFFLQGPWHVSTTLACFIAFALVAGARSTWRPLTAALVLALSITSDASTVVIGALPVLIVGLVQLARSRSLRASHRTLFVAPVAVLLTLVIRVVGKSLGMYTLVNRNLVISLKQLRINLHLLIPHLEALFGVANLPPLSVERVSGLFVVVRLVELAVVIAMLGVGLFGGGRLLCELRHRRDPLSSTRVIEALLLVCFVIDLAFFVIGSANGHVEFTKYLTTAMLAVAIASSRLLGRAVSARATRVLRLLSAPAAALLVLSAVQFYGVAVHRAPFQKTHQLVAFLEAHHLSEGVASYPIASLVTVDSSLVVSLRPVTASRAGVVTSFGRQEDSAWYGAHRFTYLVYDTSVPWHNVNRASAEHSFGKADRTYVVGPYRVLVWQKSFEIAPNPVTGGSSPLHIVFHL